jgi:hypothetical protein
MSFEKEGPLLYDADNSGSAFGGQLVATLYNRPNLSASELSFVA